jgi:DNA-binding beta-propeller fold protein YncE
MIALAFAAAVIAAPPSRMAAQQRSPAAVPVFEVDPFWPKLPLPKEYYVGDIGGVAVDANDHVWIFSRVKTLAKDQIGASLDPPLNDGCFPAPSVIEFDADGKFVQGWGGPGPGYEWLERAHGIYVDHQGNVWLGGNDAKDHQILKFSHDGKFLLQIGHAGKSRGSLDTENLNKPASLVMYQKTNEVFVADGYGNRRIIVFDADTGQFKRMWGAYGNTPDDAAPNSRTFEGAGPPQYGTIHGVKISNDDLVYVSDRSNNRIQVFTPQGKFLKEVFIKRQTRDPRGTAFDVAFSTDREQKFLYVLDGSNDKMRILDRQTMEEVGAFGHAGPYAGQWYFLHSLAADSKGNIYTGESRVPSRVQKFVFKGLSRTGRTDQ